MNWKKVARWATLNGLLAAMFVLGNVYAQEWAVNIAVFIMWIMVAVSFVMIFAIDDLVKDTLTKKPEFAFSVPEWVDNTFDVLLVLTLVGFGYIFLAIGYFLHIVVISIYRDKLETARASVEEPTETS